MIQHLEVTGVHMQVGDDLQKYVTKKIGRLDRYIPKAARESAHVQVKLKESKAKNKNERTCEVLMHLPGEEITVSEVTSNIFAAVDIVEVKLKNKLKKYKDLQANPKLHQRMLSKFKHRPA